MQNTSNLVTFLVFITVNYCNRQKEVKDWSIVIAIELERYVCMIHVVRRETLHSLQNYLYFIYKNTSWFCCYNLNTTCTGVGD